MAETIDASDDRPGQLPHPAVRAHVEKMLGSETFAQAPMLRRLLQYVADHTLEGHERELKEYAIGVDVFNRGETFDPRTDTIVRVQARRLRLKIAEYYAREGQDDAVVIELRKGHYGVHWRTARPAGGTRPAAPPSPPPPSTVVRPEVTPDRSAEAAPPSIVVLPFANLTGDDEYLADGLTDEIINTLAAVPALRVVARTSAFQFKGRSDDIREIGRQLGVQSALEGSVRKDGQRVRVTAQLIDVADGFHLWSHIYEGELPGVFKLQEETTRAIVAALRIRLAAGDHARLRPEQPASMDAYELYLKGRYLFHKGTLDHLGASVQYMQRAIDLDANYAAAYAGMADAHLIAIIGNEPVPQLLENARRAARRALELADLAEAHCAMAGVLAIADWDWRAAEREYRRALELKPSYVFARIMYASTCLCPLRRYEEAIEHLRLALTVDPVAPWVRAFLGQTLAIARRPGEAVEELRHALDLEPDLPFCWFTLALAHLVSGSYTEAIAALEPIQHLAVQYPNCAGHLGYAQARAGHRAEAERILQALLDHFQGAWAPWIDIAAIHNGLGHTTQALDWLELGYRNRCFDALFVRDDPRFVNLRDTPRFTRLAAKLAANAGAPPGPVE